MLTKAAAQAVSRLNVVIEMPGVIRDALLYHRVRTARARLQEAIDQAEEKQMSEIEELKAKIAELTARAEKAEANYQFMVDRAANEKLDGYRELAAKCAELEAQRDRTQHWLDEFQGLASEETIRAMFATGKAQNLQAERMCVQRAGYGWVYALNLVTDPERRAEALEQLKASQVTPKERTKE